MRLCVILAAILVCFAVNVKAENKTIQKPDYALIEKTVTDKTSRDYYPKLIGRYQNNDTTLTDYEYVLLYYGSFFYEYDKGEKEYEGMNDSINNTLDKEVLTKSDFEKISRFIKLSLLSAPFDLKKLNILYRVSDKLDDTVTAAYTRLKLRKIVSTILATGDGLSDTTGYHVRNIPDEYFILNALGYEWAGQQSLVNQCDYLALKENKNDMAGLYFDVSQIFVGYSKMFKGDGADFFKNKKSKRKKEK